jgi:hypothetical protein
MSPFKIGQSQAKAVLLNSPLCRLSVSPVPSCNRRSFVVQKPFSKHSERLAVALVDYRCAP